MFVAAVFVAVAATVQAVTGFGFSLVAVPVLAAVVGPLDAVRLVNVLSWCLNAALVAGRQRHVRTADAMRLLVPATAAALVAGVAAHAASESVLRVAIGLATVGGAVLLATGWQPRAIHHRHAPVAAGVACGIGNTVSGIGGPPVAMYATAARWEPIEARATLPTVFLAVNTASIAVLGFPTIDGAWWPLALLAAAAGLLSRRPADRMPSPVWRGAVLVVAAVTGLATAARAFL